MSFIFKFPASSPDEVATLRICITRREDVPIREPGCAQYLIEITADGLSANCGRTFEAEAFAKFMSKLDEMTRANIEMDANLNSAWVADFKLRVWGDAAVRHAELVLLRPRDWKLSAKHLIMRGEISVQLDDASSVMIF